MCSLLCPYGIETAYVIPEKALVYFFPYTDKVHKNGKQQFVQTISLQDLSLLCCYSELSSLIPVLDYT